MCGKRRSKRGRNTHLFVLLIEINARCLRKKWAMYHINTEFGRKLHLPFVEWVSLSICNCSTSSTLSTPVNRCKMPSTIPLRLAGKMPTWSPGSYCVSFANISTSMVDLADDVVLTWLYKFFGLYFVLPTMTFLLWNLANCTFNGTVSLTGTKRTLSMVSDSLCSVALETDSSVSRQNVSHATWMCLYCCCCCFAYREKGQYGRRLISTH